MPRRMVNLNITIPDKLHRKLKIDAAMKGQTLKELVIKVIDKEAKQYKVK